MLKRINLCLAGWMISMYLFGQNVPNPIMFCTQIPNPIDFASLMATFANHEPRLDAVPRGGDLYIRYPNGNLKNLTQLAGYGTTGAQQGANAIAVRDPHVHWDGTKALFSMVIGAAVTQYQVNTYYWQIYEVTGLGENDTPIITKIPNQPINYNNVNPIYGTDGRIIFVSDHPRGGQAHLYPQHDEYESTNIVTGLWRIDPKACSGVESLEMLTHSPSGDFTPIIDSYGRIIFTRWDHLKRDQQADADIMSAAGYGTFNYSDESLNATKSNILPDIEVFPEPRAIRTDLYDLAEWDNVNPQDINLFQPWMIREDGTELETVNHIGRHELAGDYFLPNFDNDDNLSDFYSELSANPNPVSNIFHLKESQITPGLYYATEAGEFGTHASGGIVSLYLPAGLSPEDAVITYITHPDTQSPSETPSADHSGLYRNPIPLSNGEILVSHSSAQQYDENIGTSEAPRSHYDFRLELLTPIGQYFTANGNYLTGAGISKTVTWWSPDAPRSYEGLLWETFPTEVVARPMPTVSTLDNTVLASPEQSLFNSAGINVVDFKRFLKRNDLALAVTRNVTSRDDEDIQQPYNLKVFNSSTQNINPNSMDPSRIYEVKYLQYLQGDQLRGKGGIEEPRPGRRVIAQYLHDDTAMRYNMPTSGNQGSVNLSSDGSVAAILPANRAMTWQLTDETNKPIVRERIWMSFVPGEIRMCNSCHGENDLNQAGNLSPENPPIALTNLLNHIQTIDSDNDATIDLYDFYPQNGSLQIGEAINENFANQLANWLVENNDNDAVQWQSETGESCNGNVSTINNRLTNNSGTTDQLSQSVDLTLFGKANLQFDVAYARYNATFSDGLRVKIVTCNGQTETIVYEKSGLELATAPDQTAPFIPADCDDWRSECIDLTAFAGQVFELVFENIGGFGNKLYLDNIKITEQNGNEVCGLVLALDEVTTFEATVNAAQAVSLNWKMRNETNVESYQLERSKDGQSFEKLTEVAKKSNPQSSQNYQFVDQEPYRQYSYYRLLVKKIDGQQEYSDLRQVFISDENSMTLSVSPNPVQAGFTTVQLHTKEEVSLRLQDITGSVLWSKTGQLSGQVDLDLSQYPAGVYLLEMTGTLEKIVEQIVIVESN